MVAKKTNSGDGKRIGYVRVSSADQNDARQLDGMALDKTFTDKSHRFSIDWNVICQLAALMGVDTIHSGMWGGYMSESEESLTKTLKTLRDGNVVPALSCGMHAGLIEGITKRFGVDYMANVGGAIHGHPMGTVAGAKAIRQSIDKAYGMEYGIAVNKWGIKS